MPMLVLLAQEAARRRLVLSVHTMSVVRRGLCTFVEKTRAGQVAGSHFSLVVNTEDELSDMPSGKENITDVTLPTAIAREADGRWWVHSRRRTSRQS
jgi:hypothetical protein